MIPVVLSPAADADVTHALEWLARNGVAPSAVDAFREDLALTLALIAEWPRVAPLVRPGSGLRRRALRRFPDSVLYAVDEDFIRIVALVHDHQNGPDPERHPGGP